MSESRRKRGGENVDAPQSSPEESASAAATDVNAQDAVKPFQDASLKYIQAAIAAQESVVKESLQAYLEFQQTARKLEQEAYDAVMEATRKHLDRISQPPSGGPEQSYFAQAQSQFEYENDVRQAYMNAQTRLQEVAQQSSGPDSGQLMQRFTSTSQDAYQQYLADLRQAWANVASLDPQTVKAIASNILYTLNVHGL